MGLGSEIGERLHPSLIVSWIILRNVTVSTPGAVKGSAPLALTSFKH